MAFMFFIILFFRKLRLRIVDFAEFFFIEGVVDQRDDKQGHQGRASVTLDPVHA